MSAFTWAQRRWFSHQTITWEFWKTKMKEKSKQKYIKILSFKSAPYFFSFGYKITVILFIERHWLSLSNTSSSFLLFTQVSPGLKRVQHRLFVVADPDSDYVTWWNACLCVHMRVCVSVCAWELVDDSRPPVNLAATMTEKDVMTKPQRQKCKSQQTNKILWSLLIFKTL